MRGLLVLITILAISGWTPMTQSSITAVLNIFKTGIDIFKTGFQIVNLIRKQNSGSAEDIQVKLEEVRRGLERMIRSSTTDIILEITLQKKLDRIESIVKELRSLLIDMKNYVLSDNEVDRENYKSLFLERFDQRVVAMIRELPGLLTYNIPGLSKPLTELIIDKSKCNMTAIHQFQLFYADLLSDGSSLQLVFRELSGITSTDVEEFWKEQLPNVQGQFDDMEKICTERQPDSATDEIKQNINADVMYKNCKERYTWAWCDVLYYPPMGTFQFHYHKSAQNLMFWNKMSSNGRNQIMVIGDTDEVDKAWNPAEMNSALASNKDTLRSVIDGSEDSSAAMKIGNAVEDLLKKEGFRIGAIIVYFDAQSLGKSSQAVDMDSPGAYVGVDGVTLKYCYNTGAACAFTRWDLLNFNDDWKNDETYAGDEAESRRGILSLKYPIEYGIITNWDDFDVLLDHTFKSQLRIDPKELAVLMTEPALNPRANRAKLCQILFEKYEVPGFYLQNTAALTMYAAGRMTGVAVESGYGSTFSSVVYEGYVLPHTIPKTLYCGRDFDWYLLKLLHKRGYHFDTAAERTEVPKMKEKLCFVSEDFDRDLELSRNSDEFEKSYELPDGRKICVNSERLLVGEGLFNPSLMDNDFPGIHEHVNNTLQRADLDLRRFTYNNIVLSGGNTMFTGFKERLLKEMKKLAPSSLLPKVVAIPERKMAAWLGGSIMSSLSTMEQLWITPQEYEENGPGIVGLRCF